VIGLTDKQYEAIGRLAVQSGTLEREIEEYLSSLGEVRSRGHEGLRSKIGRLRTFLRSKPAVKAVTAEFDFALDTIFTLIEARNTVVHGVWSMTSNAPLAIGDVASKRGARTVHAREISDLAEHLRTARKLLLRLFHDYLPVAAGHKTRPKATAEALRKRLPPLG
jgi:hypothetical protein